MTEERASHDHDTAGGAAVPADPNDGIEPPESPRQLLYVIAGLVAFMTLMGIVAVAVASAG